MKVTRPFTTYATLTTWPATISYRNAGRTVRYHAGRDEYVARMTKEAHLKHGAAASTVEARTWTSTPWEPLAEGGTRS